MNKLKDLSDAGFALTRWFASQEISPEDGSWILIELLGEIFGDMADSEKTSRTRFANCP